MDFPVVLSVRMMYTERDMILCPFFTGPPLKQGALGTPNIHFTPDSLTSAMSEIYILLIHTQLLRIMSDIPIPFALELGHILFDRCHFVTKLLPITDCNWE